MSDKAKGMGWTICFFCGKDRNAFRPFLYFPKRIRDKKENDTEFRVECSVCRTKIQQAWHHYRRPYNRPTAGKPVSVMYQETDKLYDTNRTQWKIIQKFLNNKLKTGSGRWDDYERTTFHELVFAKPTLVKPKKTLKIRVEVVKPIPAPRRPRLTPTPAPRTIVPYRPIPAPRNR